MALIVITISDDDDGSVDVQCVAEPALPMAGHREATAAHAVAITMLTAAAKAAAA